MDIYSHKKSGLSSLRPPSIEEEVTDLVPTPLPLPPSLKDYESEESLLKMPKKQAEHRMSIEKIVVTSRIRQSERSQNYVFFITILFLALITFLAFFNTPVAIALCGILVKLIAIFVTRKRKNTNKKQEE